MEQEKRPIKKNRDFFTTGEERGTIGGEMRGNKKTSSLKENSKGYFRGWRIKQRKQR